MDAQIWYAIFSTIVGGILGAFSHLGEVCGFLVPSLNATFNWCFIHHFSRGFHALSYEGGKLKQKWLQWNLHLLIWCLDLFPMAFSLVEIGLSYAKCLDPSMVYLIFNLKQKLKRWSFCLSDTFFPCIDTHSWDAALQIWVCAYSFQETSCA